MIPALLLACSSPELQAPPAPPPEQAPPDLILVVVDTLRADRLHLYGAERPTSPHLDALAQDAVVFERAYAPAPWTLPSMASILTGLNPTAHRVTEADHTLPDGVVTLAEQLGEAGYETAFFGVNPYFRPARQLAQGFDTYQGLEGVAGEELNQRVAGFLRVRDPGSPLFLVVHYFEPHCPYTPPPALAQSLPPQVGEGRRISDAIWSALPDCYQLTEGGAPQLSVDAHLDAYDGEVLQADGLVGALLEILGQRGLVEGSWIAVAGDHGEAFWEEGRHGHGLALEEAVVRVPLVIRPPGGGARRVAAPVSLTGLAPTALVAAGLQVPQALRGGDLLGEVLPGEVLLATDYEVANSRGLITGDQMLRLEGPEDPGWSSPLGLQLSALLAEEAHGAAGLVQTPLPAEEDLIEQLRAIGYLH